MAAPKFTKTERAGVLARVAQLDRRGYSLNQIGEVIGVSHQNVHRDLKKIRAAYAKMMMEEHGTLVAQKRAQYREVLLEAWEAWEQSKGVVIQDILDAFNEAVERLRGMSPEDAALVEKVVLRPSKRLPADAYLDKILKCLAAERELLGLDPEPAKGDGTVVNIHNNVWDMLSGVLPGQAVPDEVEEKVNEPLRLPYGLKELPQTSPEKNGASHATEEGGQGHS